VPNKTLLDCFSIDQMREGLPSQSGYLVLQMSEDMQSLYIAYAQVNKERKF
jgi:hypothetical protein